MHSKHYLPALLAIGLGSTPTAGRTCDLCAIYTATEAHGGNHTGFIFGAAEQFTHFGTLQFDGVEEPDPIGQEWNSSITQALVGYDFDRISIQLNIPYIHRSYRRAEGFAVEEGTESGFGDLSLVARYLAWHHESDQVTGLWHVLAGIKLPTGSSDRLQEELHEVEIEGAPESGIHGHDLALGSGSFDGVVGTSLYLRSDRAFVTGSAQYSIRSEGDYGYRYANDFCGKPARGLSRAQRQYLHRPATPGFGRDKGQGHVPWGIGRRYGDHGCLPGPPSQRHLWPRPKRRDRLGHSSQIDNTALQSVPDHRIRAGLTWRY
ncbi:MAG: hypothetical protein R3F31_09085 [Verrucomicrobiales bacterium]